MPKEHCRPLSALSQQGSITSENAWHGTIDSIVWRNLSRRVGSQQLSNTASRSAAMARACCVISR